MRSLILLFCVALFAATVTSSTAIITEEAMEQALINTTVERIEKETGIHPAGWILVKDIRAISTEASPEQLLWIQFCPELREPIYSKDSYDKVIRVKSLTLDAPVVCDSKYSATTVRRGIMETILINETNIDVDRFPPGDYGNATTVLTVSRTEYNIIPSNSTAWDLYFNNRLALPYPRINIKKPAPGRCFIFYEIIIKKAAFKKQPRFSM